MPKIYALHNFRQIIFLNLKKRNKYEHENIKALILKYNRLYDQLEAFQYEAKQLSYQNEKLREELQNPHEKTSSSLTSSNTSTVVVQQLEQKVYKLQEEVTDLHRRRSENAQQLVELNNCLQERDKLVANLENKLAEKESELMLARESVEASEASRCEADALTQLLRDEYQALNLINLSLEEKYKNNQEEYQELIQRWMLLKAKDADRLNEENEAASRKRQESIELDLKEASLEPRVVNEDYKFATASPICISSSLPSKPFLTFEGHEGEVNALVFSSQGHLLASGGSDRRIKLWDVSHGTAEARGTLVGSSGGVNAIDFNSEESLVLGASSDYACRVWTTPDMRLRHTLTGHSGKVMASKFLIESSRAVTGSYDRTLKIWDLRSKVCTKTLFPGSSCNDLVVSDSQISTVVSGHFDKTVKFWDIRSEVATATVTLQGKVTSLDLSKDGLYLLCSVRDDTLRIIDLRANRVCQTLSHEGFHIGADYSRAVFSPDGAYVSCGCSSGALCIWDAHTGNIAKDLHEHSACVMAVAWHPNGKTLATCDKSKKIIVWSDF